MFIVVTPRFRSLAYVVLPETRNREASVHSEKETRAGSEKTDPPMRLQSAIPLRLMLNADGKSVKRLFHMEKMAAQLPVLRQKTLSVYLRFLSNGKRFFDKKSTPFLYGRRC
jgi:hypothetical protein